MSTATEHIVLYNVSLETYKRLRAESSSGRTAYDQGMLEIMSPSAEHERCKKLIGRLVETFTLEMDVDMMSSSSTTLTRDDVDKGIEADESYYIQHAADVRGKDSIDLSIDPPPDLGIEIDITRSSLDKQAITAALGLPELWRYDGTSLVVYLLDDAGAYQRVEQSSALPQFPINEAQRLLSERNAMTENEIVRAFQQWVVDNN